LISLTGKGSVPAARCFESWRRTHDIAKKVLALILWSNIFFPHDSLLYSLNGLGKYSVSNGIV
jgi:hypothetical protein